MRELRATALLALALSGIPAATDGEPLTILDVPFIAQSELLCGGAAAAMVMRYWGERGIDAETFTSLVDRKAGGIRAGALASDIRARQWQAVDAAGTAETLSRELQRKRPVIVLLEERRGTFHYVVVVARSADGVVFHDPARAPFRVASAAEFDRRWSASGHWMLVVTPATPDLQQLSDSPPADLVVDPALSAGGDAAACDQLVADGVRQAQAEDLASAERTFASAMTCPGAAPFRELAGLRVLQRRWPEATDLAAAAVKRDPSDAYSWRLLATARFVSDDRLNALDAWNRVGEPRIDLIRLDGLTRTRFAVVQRLIGLRADDVLNRDRLLRARRRLGELPSAGGVALDFQPVPSGLAEVRGVVAERPLFPHGPFDFGVLSLATIVTRQFSASLSSPTGGGERLSVDWRFWPHRPLYQLSFAAPAPWGGMWAVTASRERQPFTAAFASSLHDSAQLDIADWMTGAARWELGAGADRWNPGAPKPPGEGGDSRTFATLNAGIRLITTGGRVDARVRMRSWLSAGESFQSGQALVTARSSSQAMGTVVVGAGGVGAVTASAPGDLWFAGDTGRARPLLLRAHPILSEGARFRTERLGRLLGNGSLELQQWWKVGPFRVGGATFADVARTARRVSGGAVTDVDVGVGFRGAYPGKTAGLRIDVAKGLRDGGTAFSVVYSP
jgi:hypothetical protein